jgi:TPR repeat protein
MTGTTTWRLFGYVGPLLSKDVAQTTLGVMYEHGQGGLAQDDAEAVKWYRKAAERGVAYAPKRLGLVPGHNRGRGRLAQRVN